MAKNIEKRHIVGNERRIVDVRPWPERMQEKLSDPGNFLLLMVPLLLFGYLIPVTLPFGIAIFLAAHIAVMRLKVLLPYRYPAHLKTPPDPKAKADGILYAGGVRSDSSFERFKQCWLSDSDLRKHWLILGSTGSGKSETLKGIFYNCLCWGSGFFCADGKADNKLPTDGYTMARAFGRDDDILALNFLLGGKTPQQVARSRRRRSNRLNPFSSGDADTLVQMGANLLPKAEGDGKSWQEKALLVWRAVITALCYKRDNNNFPLSVGVIIDYLALTKIEELYLEGYKEFEETGSWSYGYAGIKNYLDSGCPAYSVEKLLRKHNLIESPAMPAPGGRRPAPGKENEQDAHALEQHGYRVGQLMPVLNLLDKTYGYIFQAPFPEIDMIDVALHNRILFLLIPSLEKSSQEAENLGKLAIACLRVMMARNLGAELEGTREELIESKATRAPYPFVVALDELGYYFADGIAVMFAQARSLGISMIAAAQDLEKLTEGSRAAEAGAMIGNAVNKIFMKIDDAEKTFKLVQNTVGKVRAAARNRYDESSSGGQMQRQSEASVDEMDWVPYQEMQAYKEGEAVVNALGTTSRINTFYMGDWLEKLNNKTFHINRFLQVYEPSDEEVRRYATEIPTPKSVSQVDNGRELMRRLKDGAALQPAPMRPVFAELARTIRILDDKVSGIDPIERGVVLYLALKHLVKTGAAAAPATQVQAGDIDVPATASALHSLSQPLAQTLDEFGLPDPLSLLRKPVPDILQPPDEAPPAVPAPAARTAATPPSPFGTIPGMSNMPGFPATNPVAPEAPRPDLNDFGFGFEPETRADPVDSLIEQGRPAGTGSPAAWVSQAVADARGMVERPRSADHTAVGLSDDTMRELEDLERGLGSQTPKTAAHTMQQVVAAQTTPDTVGKGQLSEDEIENFFADALGAGGAD